MTNSTEAIQYGGYVVGVVSHALSSRAVTKGSLTVSQSLLNCLAALWYIGITAYAYAAPYWFDGGLLDWIRLLSGLIVFTLASVLPILGPFLVARYL